MPTVDEYVKMAEEAAQENAHVAALTYYRDAIEETGYGSNAEPVLLAAVQYAQRLKKERDRKAISEWSRRTIEKITPQTDLVEKIKREIARLETGGKENAAP